MHFQQTLFITSVDPSLGKVDKESLPQQTLMELLISGITNKTTLSGPLDTQNDIHDWDGITVNDTTEIIEVNCARKKLDGSVHLEWLPSTVEHVSFESTGIQGTVDLAHLPERLRKLDLSDNALTGPVSLENLPGGMCGLRINENQLSGSLNLEDLPVAMIGLYCYDNRFNEASQKNALFESWL